MFNHHIIQKTINIDYCLIFRFSLTAEPWMQSHPVTAESCLSGGQVYDALGLDHNTGKCHMIVNWSEREQGSGPKGVKVLYNTGGLLFIRLSIRPS